MGLLRQALDDRRERRSFGEEAARIPGPTEGARTFAGPTVTESSALGVIDVYTNVSIIADSIAMLPIRAFRHVAWRDLAGEARTYARKLPRQPLILTDPMPGVMSPQFLFKHQAVTSFLLNGNSYNEVNAIDAEGRPSIITPIHSQKIRKTELTDSGQQIWEMHDGRIMGAFRDGGTMVHMTGFGLAGGLKGLSPIQAAMQGISLTMAAEEFGARWFGDGAHPSLALKSKEDPGPDNAKRVKREFVQTFGGLNREPIYLYGDLELETIQIAPEESQFIETRQFQSSQMAKLFRVPPHLTGDPTKSTSWGTGIEEQNLAYAIFTLGPWISRIEEAMSMLLARGQFSKFNMGALLRARITDRYTAYAQGRQWGWLSVNDIRELEDLHPIPDGDTYLQPLNMIDAAEAIEVQTSQGDTNGPPPIA